MQQQSLDYQSKVAEVQTFRWSWDYSKAAWEAALRGPSGEEYHLRHEPKQDAVRAIHGGNRWTLTVTGHDVHMRADEAGGLSATLAGREIKFSDDTAVLKDAGGWFSLTMTEQLRFTRGSDVVLTMRHLFWSRSGRRVRVTTTATGARFHGRPLLVLLGSTSWWFVTGTDEAARLLHNPPMHRTGPAV